MSKQIGNLEVPEIINKYDAYGKICNSNDQYYHNSKLNDYGHDYFDGEKDWSKIKLEHVDMYIQKEIAVKIAKAYPNKEELSKFIDEKLANLVVSDEFSKMKKEYYMEVLNALY